MQKAQCTHTTEERSKAVQRMFDSIAKRYDVGNTVLSFGVHHLWRKKLVELCRPAEKLDVLDVCTGTGDLLPLLKKRFSGGKSEGVKGLDFSSEMLEIAAKKFPAFSLLQGDALALPYGDAAFDIVSVAFGVRNFADLNKGLSEALRVLKPGGSLLVLEFGQPRVPVFSQLYSFYSAYIMPVIGGLVTGNREAYTYLPETAKAFPCGKNFENLLKEIGFEVKKTKSLFFGIAYAYRADKLGSAGLPAGPDHKADQEVGAP